MQAAVCTPLSERKQSVWSLPLRLSTLNVTASGMVAVYLVTSSDCQRIHRHTAPSSPDHSHENDK